MDDFGPGQTEFPSICGPCGLPIIRTTEGKGKRRITRESCGCTRLEPTATPKPRSVKNTSAKGGQAETEIVRLMTELGFDAYKTAGSGAHGSRVSESSQDTDVVVRFRNDGNEVFRAKVESKFMANVPGLKSFRSLLSGSNWLRVRQNREAAYWFMPEDQLRAILGWAVQGMRK